MPLRPPAVFTIPAGICFVDALAQGIHAQYAARDPLALSTLTILLPTRRAVRSQREAFLRLTGGRIMLLPRMLALGDVDAEELAFGLESAGDLSGPDMLEIAPPIAGLRRQFLLMRLINGWCESRAMHYPPAASARLAADLARFLDQIQTEQRAEHLQQTALAALVPDSFAAHWQETLEFLKILTTAWPEILRDEGALDPASHRNAMLSALADRWRNEPPQHPIIAAGSTGSVPATAALLEIVAQLPNGAVVLPGLDRDLDEDAWENLDQGHPQYGLARLLSRMLLTRPDVKDWPGHSLRPNTARARLLSEALRPAETTDAWRNAAAHLAPALDDALTGFSRIEAPAPREEAACIALAMRETLQTPGKTVALVTPDRGLARRVAVELGRWGIEADDSAGIPLAQTQAMTFIRLLMNMASEQFAPVPLLAASKHPLAAAGMEPAQWRRLTREFERETLRGLRPAPGIAGLYASVDDDPKRSPDVKERLRGFVDHLARHAELLIACHQKNTCPLTDYIEALLTVAESFAATPDQNGDERLWRGDAGEAVSVFFADLREHAPACVDLPPQDIPALLEALLEGQAVRPRYGRHPRLFIWGPLEARLQYADRIILGGLNEGVWPASATVDPWLSRPMREKVGLAAPERRIGLAAHDFVQLAAMPDVILTRSRKQDGSPAAPSRWLLRIENLLEGMQAKGRLSPDHPWTEWALALDRPPKISPATAPLPRPPLAARPRRLSVSDIATLIRDPYAIYARHILGLRELDPLDEEIDASDRGTVIHRILELFVRAHPGKLEFADLKVLRLIGQQHFDTLLTRPGVRAFWKPRFDDIAEWFFKWDTENRHAGAIPAGLEIEGTRDLEAPGGRFTVRAIADRIDRLPDGTFAIYDYKTGYNPAPKQIKAGFAPQLPIEGAIARAGGFTGLAAAEITSLAIIRIRGIDPPGEIVKIETGQIEESWQGLCRLIGAFDNPQTAYVSRRAPQSVKDRGAYDHLARVCEWSASGNGDSE